MEAQILTSFLRGCVLGLWFILKLNNYEKEGNSSDRKTNTLSELISGLSDKKSKGLSFKNLVSKYLEYHGRDWVNSARKRNKELLNKYLRKDFPDNSTTKEMIIRVINVCNNWSFKHGLIKKPIKKKGEQMGDKEQSPKLI